MEREISAVERIDRPTKHRPLSEALQGVRAKAAIPVEQLLPERSAYTKSKDDSQTRR